MSIGSMPLADPCKLLTVVITTSPTPSAPSTELISAVFRSFTAQCPPLTQCRVIVVFDHYDQVVTNKPRLKKGQISPEQAEAYTEYKLNVKKLVTQIYLSATEDLSPTWISSQVQAESGSPLEKRKKCSVTVDITSAADERITFIEPRQRLGFGLAVRTALRTATTPYVWIHQHDWTLELPIPLTPMLEVMEASKNDALVPVEYICLPSCRLLDYAISDHVTRYPALSALTQTLKRDFVTSSGDLVPLTPMFFWHDKPHIANREHYLARVFPSRLSMSRGAFIEDTIGQRARNQMKEGEWAKWACWLLHPANLDTPFIRHTCGRTWRGEAATKLLIQRQIEESRQNSKRKELDFKANTLEVSLSEFSLDDH
ncbi:hypothetical protein HJFPF1_11018 [Paramyrothecium foliicola]|nr:hypothetical protein HJFPF1_11018 [Paramyrothecium foliicola]